MGDRDERRGAGGESLLERYLGPPELIDEPSAAALTAYVAGELEANDEAAAEAARCLEAYRPLAQGIAEALAIADDDHEVEAPGTISGGVLSLAALRAGQRAQALTLEAAPLALAADDQPPLPEDRRCLLADDDLALHYFRRRGAGQLLLVGAAVTSGRARVIEAHLGDESLTVVDEDEGQRVCLGALSAPLQLDAVPLVLVLSYDGERLEARWSLSVAKGPLATPHNPEPKP